MTTRRVIALVVGCLLVLPGAALLLVGGTLALAYGIGRDDTGYLTSPTVEVASAAPAVVARDAGVVLDAGTPDWVLRRLDADMRVRLATTTGDELFVGVGPAADVDAYLAGVAHDEVVGSTGTTTLTYEHLDGTARPDDPAAESFWLASDTGTGPLALDWAATRGDWTVVVMNADGSAGVGADVTAGARVGALVVLANTSLWLGVSLVGAGTVLVVVALRRRRPDETGGPGTPAPVVRDDALVSR